MSLIGDMAIVKQQMSRSIITFVTGEIRFTIDGFLRYG